MSVELRRNVKRPQELPQEVNRRWSSFMRSEK
jgi:hypothetical protein